MTQPEPTRDDIRRAMDELDEQLARTDAALERFRQALADSRAALAELRGDPVTQPTPPAVLGSPRRAQEGGDAWDALDEAMRPLLVDLDHEGPA